VHRKGLWDYRDRTTFSWKDEGTVNALESLHISVVHGYGSLVGPNKVKVTDWHSQKSVEVQARSVLVATGSEPIIPQAVTSANAQFWIPRDAVSAREVPEHLIILGAGPVGVEFATIYARLGSRVTLVSRGPRILPGVLQEASERVQHSLDGLHVELKLQSGLTHVRQVETGVVVELDDGTEIAGTKLLVAVGRKPRTIGMGLAAFGIEEGEIIDVDEHLRAKAVADGWLYALGDTNGLVATTHMGMYEATICTQHIIEQNGKQIIPETGRMLPQIRDTIPQTCFTEPQISWVGMSLQKAQGKGLDAQAVTVETGGPGTHSYLHAEDYNGFAQWVIQRDTGKILGATFVGKRAADLLHASTVAVVSGCTWQSMLHAVPSFPTLSEAYSLLVQACLATTL
jgi:pyruvate/2-oxoglutarate dehydrogenase complex dihydrolipoamide dehydrogenase (E3) component